MQEIFKDEFDSIFEIMQNSFPKDEYRSYKEQKALFERGQYRVFAEKGKDSVTAFAAVWDFPEFLFIEHIAVTGALRGRGTGSLMLGELVRKFRKRIVLEVEPPTNETAERRVRFYKRNGFYLNEYPYFQPAFSKDRKSVELMIMTSLSPAGKSGFERIRDILYTNVYNLPGAGDIPAVNF